MSTANGGYDWANGPIEKGILEVVTSQLERHVAILLCMATPPTHERCLDQAASALAEASAALKLMND